MKVIVRYLSGPSAGSELEFGDEAKEIRFGRGADNDVPFPVELNVVSREHFALVRELGGWKFRINSEKPVMLNGRPAFDNSELPETADIQLSAPEGPKLRIERVDASGSNMVKTRIVRPQETMESALAATRTGQRRTWVTVLGLFAAGAALALAGFYGWQATQTQVAEVKTEAAAAKTGVAEVKSTAEAIKQDVEATRAQVQAISQDLPTIKEQVSEALRSVDFSGVIEANKLSVYLVAVRRASGEVMGSGTAWVVEVPGRGKALATNAHVAEAFNEVQASGGSMQLVAIQPNPQANFPQVTVQSVEFHPAYAEFNALANRLYAMAAAGVARPVNVGAAYDAALMFVDRPETLGPAMQFATREEMLSMKSGYPLVTIGFPGENVMGTQEMRPSSTDHSGMVTAMTTHFLSPSADTAENQLIQMSVPVTGGASGSPLMNRDGKVVGIVNMANFLFLDTNGDGQVDNNDTRIPSAIQVNFAQRADIVQELIAGQAQARLDTVYRAQWAKAEEDITKPVAAIIEDFMDEFAGYTTGRDAIHLDSEATGLMDRPQEQFGGMRAAVFTLKAEKGRAYLLIGITGDKRPVRLAVMRKQSNQAEAEIASGTAGGFVSAYLLIPDETAEYFIAPFEDRFTYPDLAESLPPSNVSLRIYSGPVPE